MRRPHSAPALLGVVLVAALALTTSAAPEDAMVLEARTRVLELGSTALDASPTILFGVPISESGAQNQFRISGQTAEVEVVKRTVTSKAMVARSANIQESDTISRSFLGHGSFLTTVARDHGHALFLPRGPGETFSVAGDFTRARLTQVQETTYRSGDSKPNAPLSGTNPADPPQFPSHREARPSIEARVLPQGLSFQVRGDLNLTLFDAVLRFRAADGTIHEFESGYTYTPQAPFGAMEEYQIVIYYLHLSNATIEVETPTRQVQLNILDSTFVAQQDVRLTDAEGVARFDDHDVAIPQGSVVDARASKLAGAIRISPGTHMGVRLEGTPTSLFIDGEAVSRPNAANPAPVPQGSGYLWTSLVAGAALGVGALIALVVRRNRRPLELLLLDAQGALLAQDYERAAAVAMRAQRRDGRNVDAVVIHTISLLKLGKGPEARALLAQSRARVEDPSGILGLLESMAKQRTGDDYGALVSLNRTLASNPSLTAALEKRRAKGKGRHADAGYA
jgi:hypothetical protein